MDTEIFMSLILKDFAKRKKFLFVCEVVFIISYKRHFSFSHLIMQTATQLCLRRISCVHSCQPYERFHFLLYYLRCIISISTSNRYITVIVYRETLHFSLELTAKLYMFENVPRNKAGEHMGAAEENTPQ